jgi:hypothetical protein
MKTKRYLLLVSLLASLSCFAADTFQVSSSVFKGGELLESPVMVVQADKRAYMTIGDDFHYELTVSPKQGETVEVSTKIKVGENSINPSLTLIYDREASVEIDQTKLMVLVSKLERK